MDPVFEEEQAHLRKTHAKLKSLLAQIEGRIQQTLDEINEYKNDMSEQQLSFDMTSDDMAMEMYAELESMNRIIDTYSRASQMDDNKHKQLEFLLQQPYFAKVSLQFKPNESPRDIYLGAAGMTDENCRHFIVDWRSPIAETYYNQQNGEMSYVANGRTIHCNLVQRRQFELSQDKLYSYFDTTVAIEDPLLLASLARERSDKLSAITTTIQSEQNKVIRHEDVPALLVEGVAGSGKTSVLLQRIAYLFYTLRDSLKPSEVYLISPNPVFRIYIDNVLPNMGESNPHCQTWAELEEEMGLKDRCVGDPSGESLKEMARKAPQISFEDCDLNDLKVGTERVISAGQVRKALDKFKHIEIGSRLAGLMEDELKDKLQQRIKRMSKNEDVHDELADLEVGEQLRIFGSLVQASTEAEYTEAARIYLADKYQPVEAMIERADWLNIDRIGIRYFGHENLSANEWLYLKMALTGCGNRDAKYVMIDEVQDYTPTQLMTIARYFKNAHFMLLGDRNQAIQKDTASFDKIEEIFAEKYGEVHSCTLPTSYRCADEICTLFAPLMDKGHDMKVSSVQTSGIAPSIRAFANQSSYLDALRALLSEEPLRKGLRAIITLDKKRAKWLSKQLGDDAPSLIGIGDALPASGTVLIPLNLAKGLEFDQVILADAEADNYGKDDLSRHRLYTALSRATKRIDILALGELTPLLGAQE